MGAATGGRGQGNAYKLCFKQIKNLFIDGPSGSLYWNTDYTTIKNNSF
jgi:hypothetical protein